MRLPPSIAAVNCPNLDSQCFDLKWTNAQCKLARLVRLLSVTIRTFLRTRPVDSRDNIEENSA